MITAAVITAGGAYLSSRSASRSSDRATQAASDAEAARLAFEQEQWDEWQATYGPVQDQLANYYETLTPTFRVTQGLEAHEKEMNRSLKKIEESFAQRGISTSGIAAQTRTELSVASAEERARIRAQAPLEVAKEKLGFLQIGLGQNPQQGMRDALDDANIRAANTAQIAAQNAGIARGAFYDAATNAAQGVATYAWNRWMNRNNTNNSSGYSGPSGPPV